MSAAETPRVGPRRVLVTGSRTWVSPRVVRDALARVWGNGDAVLVTGACRTGADRIAEMFWRRWGGQIERHPADWQRHGKQAGFNRNAAMVARGADICVAFIRNGSPGSSTTVRLSEHAGIPVWLHTQDDTGRITSPPPPAEAATSAGSGAEAAGPPSNTKQQPCQDTRARDAAPAADADSGHTGPGAAQSQRWWLDVPDGEQDAAFAAGARWDQRTKRWYDPVGPTPELERWAPWSNRRAEIDPGQAWSSNQTAAVGVAADDSADSTSADDAAAGEARAEHTAPAAGDPTAAARKLNDVVNRSAAVTAEQLARHCSYPEITQLVARAKPRSRAGQLGREALDLLLNNPDLYRGGKGGDQVTEIARSLSVEQIAAHRQVVAHGPLYEALGRAAELRHSWDQTQDRDTESAGAESAAADDPDAGIDTAGSTTADPDIVREQETAQLVASMSVDTAHEVMFEQERAMQSPGSYDTPEPQRLAAAHEVLDAELARQRDNQRRSDQDERDQVNQRRTQQDTASDTESALPWLHVREPHSESGRHVTTETERDIASRDCDSSVRRAQQAVRRAAALNEGEAEARAAGRNDDLPTAGHHAAVEEAITGQEARHD